MVTGKGRDPAVQQELNLWRVIFSCMAVAGVHYGWALQLSLLTPYLLTLGLPHYLASVMWLCGPVSGFIVAPTVGLWSDRCNSRFGRRRPFVFIGCIMICCAVLLIGFSSDLGSVFGDTKESCRTYVGPRWKAAMIFMAGFWVLDIGNNVVHAPARAMMADLSGKLGCNRGNLIYVFWMAFGNVLGFSSGAIGGWHRWFPFLMTNNCCEACANLKGAFLISVVFLSLCLTVTLICAKEISLSELDHTCSRQENSGFFSVLKAFKRLPAGMSSVVIVTSLTWLAWFPFLLYGTDWMGREIFLGDPNGTKAEVEAYNQGVQKGAFGLLLNSIILGISSMFLEPICRKFTSRVVWVMGNFTLCIAMTIITMPNMVSLRVNNDSMGIMVGGLDGGKIAALVIFAVLGFPLAILFSIPFASASQLAMNEGGNSQGDRCPFCWSMGCHLWKWEYPCICCVFSSCSCWWLRCACCSSQAFINSPGTTDSYTNQLHGEKLTVSLFFSFFILYQICSSNEKDTNCILIMDFSVSILNLFYVV